MRLSQRQRELQAEIWPEDFPDCWRHMELRRHLPCGEILAQDTFCGGWFHPAYHEASGFASRTSGFGAKCPRRGCGREIYPVDTEPVIGETQPPLFE
ncbi:MAG: hypothetical protein ACFB50_15615 [Rubrobacteraceae bacterium]